MNELGIDQVASIGKMNVLNPKYLSCSICYCLFVDGRECMNKRCKKIFCINCVTATNTSNYKNSNICPFCRTDMGGFTILDSNLTKVLKSLKIFCKRETCPGLFTLEEYSEHLNFCKSIKKKSCAKCKKINNECINKCEICEVNYCYECRYISRCLNCKANICTYCQPFTKNGKLLFQDFLCGLCERNCDLCKNSEGKKVCFLCKMYLCENCVRACDFCNHFVCSDSVNCYKNKIPECGYCRSIPLNSFYNKCQHLVYSDCNTCYPKCENIFNRDKYNGDNKCSLISDKNCASCKKKICISNCSYRCKNCKEYNCLDCFSRCSSCKKFMCFKCSISCDRCGTKGINACKDCDIDVIRQCIMEGCDTKLCLECWNVCELCSSTYCDKHSRTCINCEEKCCEKHFHICNNCSSIKNEEKADQSYRKLCHKNCVNFCSFCGYVTDSLCDPKNHQDNIVRILNCGHKICKNCLIQCGNCKNVAISCLKCIVNYYFHKCRRCNFHLCATCSVYCAKCEDVFCPKDHSCDLCEKNLIKICLSCFRGTYSNCPCGEKLKNCEYCLKMLTCDYECWKKRKSCAGECKMFYCNDECFEDYKNSNFTNRDNKLVNLIKQELKEGDTEKVFKYSKNFPSSKNGNKALHLEKVTTCSCCILY